MADSRHLDAYGGEADLTFVPDPNLAWNAMFKNDPVQGVTFRFRANHPSLASTDMLWVGGNYSNLPVMSRRMVGVIEEEGGQPLLKYPALIDPRSTTDYFVVQVPVLDIFDWDNSKYSSDDVIDLGGGAKFVSYVREYVFTKPVRELPPAFRITSNFNPLFMRGDVREALRQRRIRGVAFMEAGDYSPTNQFQTDVPV